MRQSEAIWQAAIAERIGGRNEQQDSVGGFHSRDGKACLLVVADGMGGHRGGSLASQTLLEIAERNWESCGGAPDDPKQFLEEICQQAHSQINLRGREQDLEPHSTVVALIVRGVQAFWVHVGDSRLYHFREQDLLGRTKDHSLVQVLVEAGEVSEEEMATHPDQNKLLRSIGGEEPPKATHGNALLQPQDRFLLCSDGFWEMIPVDEMAVALGASKLDQSLNHLADLAAKRGGAKGDNIAVAATRAMDLRRRSRFRMPVLIGSLLVLLVAAILFVPGMMEWLPDLSSQTPEQEEVDADVDSEMPGVNEGEENLKESASVDVVDGVALEPQPGVLGSIEEEDSSPAAGATADGVERGPREE